MSDKTAVDPCDRLAAEGVLSETDLAAVRAFDSSDSNAWAKAIIENGLLTRWQVTRLITGKGSLKLGDRVLLDRIPIIATSELFIAKPLAGGESRWLEVLPSGASAAEPVNLGAAESVSVRGELQIEGRTVVDHGPVAGLCLAQVLKKGVRWGRPETAQLVRAACRALVSAHAEDQALGRITPTQFVKSGNQLRLATWGCTSAELTAEDPYTAPEVKATGKATAASDVFSLGTTALVLAFGTTSPGKVQAKSRFDQWLVRMADPDPSKRPTIEAVAKGIDEWTASKKSEGEGEGTIISDAETIVSEVSTAGGLSALVSNSSTETIVEGFPNLSATDSTVAMAPVVLPDILKATGPQVAVLPKIAAEIRFGGEPGSEAAIVKKVKLKKAELPKRRVTLPIVIYSVVGLVITVATVIGLIVALKYSTAPPVAEVAKADQAAAANPAATPEGEGLLPKAAPGVGVANPEPLVDIEEPIVDVDPVPAPNNGGAGLPNLGSVGIAGVNAGANPNGEPAGNAEGPAEMDQPVPNETEMAVDNTPAVTEPMPTDPTPPMPVTNVAYVPAFQDLPKAAALPIVGQGEWQNEVVLGTIHLQPTDSMVAEFKGAAKAFRDGTTFDVQNADGGTAVNAFDVFSITGATRAKLSRLWVEGEQLKFRFYPEAEASPAANYLQNCHLRMRTGTDVGGLSLRMPIVLPALSLDDRQLTASSRTVFQFMPDNSQIEFKVLPFAETFPEYGLRDAIATGKAQKGTVDIVFGGKYTEAMFLQVASTLGNRLDLKVSAFALQGTRVRPFRVAEVESQLTQMKLQKEQAAATLAQLRALPAEQQGGIQNQLAAFELARQEGETGEKQATDALAFVDSIKGQTVPVAIYYLADEYKVYLATPDGQPLD